MKYKILPNCLKSFKIVKVLHLIKTLKSASCVTIIMFQNQNQFKLFFELSFMFYRRHHFFYTTICHRRYRPLLLDNTTSTCLSCSKNVFKALPSKHTTLFQRLSDVHNVESTSKKRLVLSVGFYNYTTQLLTGVLTVKIR